MIPSATSEPQPPNTARRWAIIGLVFAGIWLVFSALPLPGTTLLGLPFLGIAVGTTVISLVLRHRRAAPGVLRWAAGALAVTGLGCLWQVVMAAFWTSLIAGGAYSLWQTLQGTPIP